MKQISQDIRTGVTEVVDVPAPRVRAGCVLVHVGASLVSAGTERMIVQFAGKNLLQKVRARPDLARQVIDKARREGVLTALDAVRSRIDQPMPLGYAVAGTVIEAGAGTPFRPGDRVACAGAGHAVHAEIVSIPKTLVVSVPDQVAVDEACFATLGAIALQGVRLARLDVAGSAAVIGLGLLGQLSIQILRASGVTAVGMDIDAGRAALARASGAVEAVTEGAALEAAVSAVTGGRGVDAVLLCADTPSQEPLALAAAIARDRGVVVAVGVVGLLVPRKPFFEKELELRVSRSYGPGRYDPTYEEQGHDYPYGFVRWTEQRNLDAVIRLMAEGRLPVRQLISHRFDIADAARAFDLVTGRTGEPFLGVVLQYPAEPDRRTRVDLSPSQMRPDARDRVTLGVIGAGLFATTVLLPTLRRVEGIDLRAVSAGSGLAARAAARRFGAASATTAAAEIISDPDVSTVAILTRHGSHAALVTAALEAGKHVFVEKPLCITEEELEAIEAVWHRTRSADRPPALMVGFNRRFAPFVVQVREWFSAAREPLVLHCRVNAGYVPSTHWVQRPEEGGRLIGEGCHFIDLLAHLSPAPVRRVTARALPDSGRYVQDNFVVTLECEDGSIGTISYVAHGHKGAGKELIEISGGGASARLDDYRRLSLYGPQGSRHRRAWLRQDKGHRGEWEAFLAFLRGRGPDPMPFESIGRSMRATLAAARSLETGGPVVLDR